MGWERAVELLKVSKDGKHYKLLLKECKVKVMLEEEIVLEIEFEKNEQEWEKIDKLIETLLEAGFTVSPAERKVESFIERVKHDVVLQFMNLVHIAFLDFCVKEGVKAVVPKEKRFYKEFTGTSVVIERDEDFTHYRMIPELFADVVAEPAMFEVRRFNFFPILSGYLELGIKFCDRSLTWNQVKVLAERAIKEIEAMVKEFMKRFARRLKRYDFEVVPTCEESDRCAWFVYPTLALSLKLYVYGPQTLGMLRFWQVQV